jgi:hypothetical protein
VAKLRAMPLFRPAGHLVSLVRRRRNPVSQPHNLMRPSGDGLLSEDEALAETCFDKSFGRRHPAGASLCSPCPLWQKANSVNRCKSVSEKNSVNPCPETESAIDAKVMFDKRSLGIYDNCLNWILGLLRIVRCRIMKKIKRS